MVLHNRYFLRNEAHINALAKRVLYFGYFIGMSEQGLNRFLIPSLSGEWKAPVARRMDSPQLGAGVLDYRRARESSFFASVIKCLPHAV
jgi:hypothetical protein